MIQFNLLPDVKVAYVKAQATKRLVMSIAAIVTVVSFAIALLLVLVVYGLQKKNMNDLNKDIKTDSQKLQSTTDLDKILTIQNQLGALSGLHDGKAAATRVFTIAEQTTPVGIGIVDYTTDFTANTATISGDSPSLDLINTYADTLKFATYTDGDGASHNAFSDVVLSQFGTSDKGVSFTITMSIDPTIFKNDQELKLVVPNKITTGSVTGQPQSIFSGSMPASTTSTTSTANAGAKQ